MQYSFTIAGLEVALKVTGEAPEFTARYEDYKSHGGDAELEIQAHLDPAFELGALGPEHPAFRTVSYSDREVVLERMDLSGSINFDPDDVIRARFRCAPGPISLDSIIRACLSVALPTKGALILHSSAVLGSNKAYVFSGVSGAGKSTIARLLAADREIETLADDLVVVAKTREGWTTVVVPFASKIELPRGESHPLAAIHLLQQAPKHSREAVAANEAMSEMCRHVVSYTRSPRTSVQILELVADLVETIPCYRLCFAKNANVGEVLGITC